MKKLRISGVTKGQYKQICKYSWHKCNGNEGELSYKIRRAVNLGKQTHVYRNGCQIVRYYYLNFLISEDEIMTMWSDHSCPPYEVSERTKHLYDSLRKNKQARGQRIKIEMPPSDQIAESGFNKNIKINPKQTTQSLIDYGFTNHYEPHLYFLQMLNENISFSITVIKETLEIERIDVLDEDFCQPYDYQSILMRENDFEFARRIYYQVNNILSKMQEDGIVTGFQVGMYV